MLLSLAKATDAQLEQLSKITSLDLMKFIGKGSFWSLEEIKDLRDIEINDISQDKIYYQWLILDINDNVVGYLSLRPSPGKQKLRLLQTRIFTYPSGQGFGTQAIKNLLKIYRGNILSIVRTDNISSQKLFLKFGFVPKGNTMYGKVEHVNLQLDNRIKVHSLRHLALNLSPNSYVFTPHGKAEIIVTDDPKRINTFYGKKHILISTNPFNEKLLAIVVPNIERAIMYLENYKYADIPHDEAINSYTTCGTAGERLFWFHMKMRNFSHISLGQFVRREAGAKNINECIIKNNVQDLDNLSDKDLLSKINDEKLLALLPKHYVFFEAKRALSQQGKVIIVKPVGNGAHSGTGISVATNVDELMKAYKIASKWPKVIMQEYIKDPLLFDGKKCHFRMHILVTTWGQHYLLPDILILTAHSPYVNNDWTNKLIHDSHGSSTDDDYFWPQHRDRLSDNIDVSDETKKIFEVLLPHIHPQPYEESKMGYEILAVDYMFTKEFNGEYKTILIEINQKVGYTPNGAYDDEYDTFEKHLLEWEYDCIKEKLFGLN